MFMFLLSPLLVWLSSSLFSQTLFIAQSNALQLTTRSIPHTQLTRRGASSSPITGTTPGEVPLNDKQNIQYLSNITIGGEQFGVIVDTGSSDLWITTPSLKQSRDLNVSAGIQYALGNANGNINLASIQFAGHNVSNQAYLLVKNASSFSANLHAEGIDGLVGLGPGSGSVIRNTLGNSTGDSLLSRIFTQDTSTPPFISFLLQRNNDPTPSITGTLTIGTILPSYSSISTSPKLPVIVLSKSDERINQHWTIQLDPNGIIGPDNSTIKKSSIVPNNNGRLFAVVDSGFTLPQVPRSVSDAIYGRVQGAIWNETHGLWTVPCEQELNVTFLMGGVRFPVHPLDTVSSDFGLVDQKGDRVCAGIFQPITSAFSLSGQFDLILGMGFLRNTYTLLNFGDFISNTTTDPYIQFLPLTTPSVAHTDFVTSRLAGVDTTSLPKYSLLPSKKGQKSPVPLDERVVHTEQKIIRYRPIIIAVCVGLLLVVGGLVGWRVWKGKKARSEERRKEGRRAQLKGMVLSPISAQGQGGGVQSPRGGGWNYGNGGAGKGYYDLEEPMSARQPVFVNYGQQQQQQQQRGDGYYGSKW